MSAVELLRYGAAFIRDKGYTKGTLARDQHGTAVSAESSQATCYCTLGAVDAARFKRSASWVWVCEAKHLLLRSLPVMSYGTLSPIAEFNDFPDTTVKDVLALYDRAIALAEKEEQENAPK